MHITEYAAPVAPQYLAAAADGSLYFGNGANGSGSNLYRDTNGAFTQANPASAPSGYSPGGGVYGIAATAGQVYWLSAYNGPSFQPYVAVECGGTGTATLCEPTVDEPTTMLVDAAGTFWVGGYTYNGGGMIATSAQSGGLFPDGIIQLVNGPGNAVWGALQNYPSYAIARFVNSNGSVSVAQKFPLPSGDAIGSMTYGADGALWFTDQQRNAIGRMDSSGNLTEYPLPSAGALGNPWFGVWQITSACDGSVWFTEPGANKVGRIDAHGAILEFPIATANAYPNAIAATGGSTCAPPQVWIAEQTANKLAAIGF